jgi:myo-inositol-1(or 4)-monophosphatase
MVEKPKSEASTPVQIGIEAARRGAAVLLQHWERLGKGDADMKARHDWVSRADRDSEKAIVACIHEFSPGDAILGEESGATAGTTNRTWVIDPLDGTSNYLQHFPVWSISIALRRGDETIAGVIYEPLRDLFFTAEKGAGAFRNGARMRVSDQAEVEGSFLATGFPFRAQQHVETYCAIFQDVIRRAKGVRRAGSAAIDLAYTAASIFDAFFELQLAPWDMAAGALMIEEAGGIVTDFSGGPRWLERGNIIGAAPAMHRDLLGLINRHVSEDRL